MGLLTVWWERFHQGTQGKLFSLGLTERILVASHAVWFYLGKLLWPVNLTFSYPKWTIHHTDLLAYGWLAAGIALSAAIYFGRRYFGRGVEAAALFFVATLSPLLGFIMLYTFRFTFVADHYQYVAGISVIALAAAGITIASRRKPFLKTAICGVLLLMLGVLTWRQCRMYADAETLWQATIDRNPTSWLAQNNLGDILLHKGQLDEAMAHFQKAISIQPDNAEAHDNLGNALFQKRQVDEAIRQFQTALAIQPDFAGAYINLGNALLQKGQADEAILQYQKALVIRPDNAKAHYNLGTVLLQKGKVDEAMVEFQKALAIQPGYADAHNNLGNVLLQKEQIDEAIAHYERALAIRPDYAEAHFNLGSALLRKGQTDAAVAQFQSALAIRPDYAKAHASLGDILLQKGDTEAAMAHYQKALQISPDAVMALNNLAWILATSSDARLRNGVQAVQYAGRACELTHSSVPAFLGTLAAAYAETGQFNDAVATAQRARDAALALGQKETAANNERLMELYKSGRAFHAPPPVTP
jgi:tetratricopeptide (TPR) repeat protein